MVLLSIISGWYNPFSHCLFNRWADESNQACGIHITEFGRWIVIQEHRNDTLPVLQQNSCWNIITNTKNLEPSPPQVHLLNWGCKLVSLGAMEAQPIEEYCCGGKMTCFLKSEFFKIMGECFLAGISIFKSCFGGKIGTCLEKKNSTPEKFHNHQELGQL